MRLEPKSCYRPQRVSQLENEMTGFRILRDVALVSIMMAAQAQAHGIKGRDVGPASWSACVTDHGLSACGDPMWFYGDRGGHAGKKNVQPPEADLPPWIGD
jgi:hypothetical protein